MLEIEPVLNVIRSRLSWMCHVLRKDLHSWARRVMGINVEGSRPQERPRKIWIIVVEEDMLKGDKKSDGREDAYDRKRNKIKFYFNNNKNK